jgi:hypothetical protein
MRFDKVLWGRRSHLFWAGDVGMTRSFLVKSKIANGQRHDRSEITAHHLGGLDDAKNFERAFEKAFKSAVDDLANRKRLGGRRTDGSGSPRAY